MSHTLTAKEQPLSKIFSDDYVFTIPGYQRPYSWGIDQAQELLDDLVSFMRAGSAKLEEMAPYFLGSIVLIKKEASPESTVVDGQQRLTTLTLLLAAIRASIPSAQVKVGITKRIYEHGDVVTATENHYRLSLRDRDRNFFRDYVQHEGGIDKLVAMNDKLSDSQSKLRENAKLYLHAIQKLDDEAKTSLVQFIVTRCYLVTVATPDLDSAYRIFGVLNSRGLDLTATDILKAEIVGAIGAAKRESYTFKWEALEEDLGRDAFSDLFSHIRMVFRKAKPQGTLLREFREHVGPADPAVFIDQVLVPMAQAFREITDADYSSQSNAESINQCLRWLDRIEFKDWLPPAISFLSRHRNDPKATLLFFRDLERLAYAMLVRKSSVNERIERFSSLTAAVDKGSDLHAPDSPLQLSRVEQFATFSALSGPLYITHSARALSVILSRLDGLLSGGGASYDFDIITVEHVLPQTPGVGSEWQQWFPSAQEQLHWVHRLGNLALLTRKKNSAASNYDFAKKKVAYFSKGGVSPFALTTQVLQHSEWTGEVLEARQADLLELLVTHLRLEDRKNPQAVALEKLDSGLVPEDAVIFQLQSPKDHPEATAFAAGEQFVVLAGSKARAEWTSQDHSYKLLREKLKADGSLLQGSDGLEFSKSVEFNSPSAASGVILGRPDNGRLAWVRRGTDQTFGEWQDGVQVAQHDESTQEQTVGGTERKHVLRRFWTSFISRARDKTSLYSKRSTTSDQWLSAGIGKTGFSLNVSLAKDWTRVACFFRLSDDGDQQMTSHAFAQLLARKAEIEQRFGGPLNWESLPDRLGSRIGINVQGGWKLPEAQWPIFQDEVIRLSISLSEAMRRPIQELKS